MSTIKLTDGRFLAPGSQNQAFSLSRVPGYTGYRRKESMDHSRTRASRVPSSVVEALSGTDDVRTVFDRIDLDGNGVLDEQELTTELLRLGLGLSPAECREVFRSADNTNMGGVTFERWSQWCAELGHYKPPALDGSDQWRQKPNAAARPAGFGGHRRRESLDRSIGKSAFGEVTTRLLERLKQNRLTIQRAFVEFDTDGSQTLSSSELFHGLRENGIELNGDEFTTLFNNIDTSGDGEIQWDEFDAWLKADDKTWATVGMDVGSTSPMGPTRNRPKVAMDASIPSFARSVAEEAAPQMAQVARAQEMGEARAGEQWFARGGGRVSMKGPAWCQQRDLRYKEQEQRSNYAQRMGMLREGLGNAGRTMLANSLY